MLNTTWYVEQVQNICNRINGWMYCIYNQYYIEIKVKLVWWRSGNFNWEVFLLQHRRSFSSGPASVLLLLRTANCYCYFYTAKYDSNNGTNQPTNCLNCHLLVMRTCFCCEGLAVWCFECGKKKQQTSPLESERLLNVITHPASLSVSSSISPHVFILITSFPKKYRNKQARAEGSLTSREIKNLIYVHGLPDRCWPNCGMNEAMAMSGHSYLNTADEMEKILQFRLKCGGWTVWSLSFQRTEGQPG